MSQLVYVSDYTTNTAYSYDYDSDGNITAEYIYEDGVISSPTTTTVITYSYGDSNWGDKLTAYNGQAITYDQIGNPLTYRDGITMTWQNGRQLTTLSQGDNNISYSYDSNSIRVSKTVNGVKYTYAYVNGLLVYETRGNSRFYYSYDANGTLYSVKYMLESAPNTLITYYYTHNSRGDIVGIYNGDGVQRVKYEYDAWGNVLSITDTDGNAITDPNHIGNLNPFRYRGYYYDSETGFYYLMSRYYDPITHRFINADGYFKSGGNILDTNMSAYCRNNPIMYLDPTGDSPKTLYELQQAIVNGEEVNYNIKAISLAQKQGYTCNDRFTVSESGELIHYKLINKMWDTFTTIGKSVVMDVGIGYGIGANVVVDGIDVELLIKSDLITFNVSRNGFDLGKNLYAGVGVIDGLIKWDNIVYESYFDSSKNYSTDAGNAPNYLDFLGAEAYLIIGGHITFSLDADYINKSIYEIWG